MIPKLRIQLRHVILHGTNQDSKVRAGGYAHTYMDVKDMDLQALSVFPSDEDIAGVAQQAARESDGLILMLGVSVDELHGAGQIMAVLPSIASWYDDELEDHEPRDGGLADLDGEESDSDAHELQELVELWESAESSKLPLSCKKKIANLTCAALAITTDESIRV
jgi:hypothetical protein